MTQMHILVENDLILVPIKNGTELMLKGYE